ncbi:MAG TPA: hypothetical protein VE338_06465 [Ktedonobacterales bacterium]|nr:hypothetical protein [Ktedonobacterales bacterium]
MERLNSTIAHSSIAGATTVEPSEVRLRGVWLVVARLVAAATVAFALSVYMATMLPAFSLLRTVCASRCVIGQLTPGQAAALSQWNISASAYAAYAVSLAIVTSLVWFGVAALLFWRRSNTLYLLLVATQLVTQGALSAPVGPAPGAQTPWAVATAALSTLNVILLCLFLALFPNGRFAPRWMGWLLIPACAALVLTLILPVDSGAQLNVLSICLVGLVLAQVYRYRVVSTPLQRQQTRWVIVGIAATVLVQIVLALLPILDPALAAADSLFFIVQASVSTVALTFGPIAFAIAVLRYRLYDLGLLLNRTLVYGLVTSVLAAVYVGSVFALQQVARGVTGQKDSPLAIVLATLVVAALFQPVRARIQTFIDRRFYRRKYDAAKTLAAFSASLRSEVNIDSLCHELISVADETLRPAHVSLWLASPAAPPLSHAPSQLPEATRSVLSASRTSD